MFILNTRLAVLFETLQDDVNQWEKITQINMTEAMEALDNFARAMCKATDSLNEQLAEYKAEQARKQEVNDVLFRVGQKLRNKRTEAEYKGLMKIFDKKKRKTRGTDKDSQDTSK